MAEQPASDLPSMVQGALKVIGHASSFIRAMIDLMEKHEELEARFERLEQEHVEARQREEAARREAEETAAAFAKLRSAYEALIIEHEVGKGAFHKLHGEQDVGGEAEETAEALAELRSAYEALIIEHEVGRRAYHKLQEEHEALLEGRRQIVEELGAVMSSLKMSSGSIALGASSPQT
jgi:chromosome segregation ATPase